MFTILSTVSNLTIKTPAGLAKDEGHAIVASNYLGNDHKEHSIGALSPFSVTGSSQGINFTNIDEEKAYWKQYENKSGVKIINAVDIMGQFQNLNNMFALEDVQSSKASSFFGENHWYDYELDDKAIVNQPVDTQPMFYVTIPSGGLVLNNINNLDKLLDDPAGIEAVLSTITNYISGQNIVMIGETSADVSSIATPFTLKKFSVVENHNGWTGSRNNLENLGYDDIAVQPYSGTVKDKLFRAMLNAQIGVKQKQDAGEYQFDDLNTNTHITNTCSYIDDYNSYTNFIHQTNPTSDFQPLTRSLAQLFTPSLNVGTAEVISSTDQAYTNLFANGTSYAEYFTSSKNKGMDFPHFCFVGSNYSEENGNPRIEIRDPDTGEKLVLKNQLWQGTDETKASKALMNLMAQYKLFAFEYLTNVIKKSETSQNVSSVYDTAYNTKLGFDMNNLNINFNSSPLFLVQPNSSGSYSYMNDFINVPFIGELGEIFGILFALCPNLYQDARVQQIISFINLLLPEQDKIDWVGSWGNSYFGDPKVLNARAFLSWFTSKQEYGWKTALNPIDYDVIEANVTNLVTNVSSSGMNNFPAIYENLSAPFATNPYFEPWQIAIVWFLVGTILSAFAIVIYMRSDFK
ncbi:MAG: hypothetical protein LBS76_00305 [Mycoplasmataceae bacterium]|nr:hypothetical protein [Mycoplasmataceae bacterium]